LNKNYNFELYISNGVSRCKIDMSLETFGDYNNGILTDNIPSLIFFIFENIKTNEWFFKTK
jgi:hypothetical protein